MPNINSVSHYYFSLIFEVSVHHGCLVFDIFLIPWQNVIDVLVKIWGWFWPAGQVLEFISFHVG